MIDEEDYEAFIWIKENITEDYKKAILDPWKATAFSAVTQKYVHTRIHMQPYDIDNKVYAFIKGGSTDTKFLKDNGISIIYTRIFENNGNIIYDVRNPDLTELNKGIYIFKENE